MSRQASAYVKELLRDQVSPRRIMIEPSEIRRLIEEGRK